MTQSDSDHRRYPRIPAEYTVLVRSIDPPTEGFARTNVMSSGGCGFLTREPIEAGGTLELLVTIEGVVAQITGRSVYVRPAEENRREVGVEFLDVSADDRELIERVLVEHA
jgi:hypothetical protein